MRPREGLECAVFGVRLYTRGEKDDPKCTLYTAYSNVRLSAEWARVARP